MTVSREIVTYDIILLNLGKVCLVDELEDGYRHALLSRLLLVLVVHVMAKERHHHQLVHFLH